MKQIRFILVVIAFCVIVFIALRNYCPQSGVAFNKERREFQQLKNRTALPLQSDFETRVTLQTLLQPGDDRSRWANSRAAQLEGYVLAVYSGPLEAANCYCRRDVHIMLGPRPDSPAREQVVLEVTPPMETTKESSLEKLQRELTGRRVHFQGWLFFDAVHAGESENTAPGRANNWRATAWELHPVTKIDVLK
jgi:hypothetical protein